MITDNRLKSTQPVLRAIFCTGFVIVLACSNVDVVAAQQDAVPFEAIVHDRTASVYSGPGKVHYVTDRLAIGRRVIVYRIDPDGWLAIQPPAGSFSLVPADVVTRTDEPGVGRIVIDDVKAWVGTRLNTPTQPLWQVRLKKDERVAVIGQQPPSQNPSDVKWVRIEPPAGEFRWIHKDDVTRYIPTDVSSHEGPTEGPPQDMPDAEPGRDEASKIVRDRDSSQRDVLLTSGEQTAQNSKEATHADQTASESSRDHSSQTTPRIPGTLPEDLRRETSPLDHGEDASSPAELTEDDSTPPESKVISPGADDETATQTAGDGFVKRTESRQVDPAESDESNGLEKASSSSGAASGESTTHLVQLTNPTGQTIQLSFTAAVRNLELQMTRMATYPVEKWDTRGLHFLVKQLMEQSVSTDEKARAQQMHEKLSSYDELHSKRLALTQMMTDEKPVGTGVDPDNPIYQQSLDSENPEAAEEARKALDSYAGTGYLNRLITEHGLGKGGYVLQDQEGRIEFIVVPAPGVNLERYLSKHIAIQGNTSPSRQFNKPLITADRVIQLDRFR